MPNKLTLQLTPAQCALIRKTLMEYVIWMNTLKKYPDFKDFAEKNLNEIYEILKQM